MSNSVDQRPKVEGQRPNKEGRRSKRAGRKKKKKKKEKICPKAVINLSKKNCKKFVKKFV
jgi:hypothetical protein